MSQGARRAARSVSAVAALWLMVPAAGCNGRIRVFSGQDAGDAADASADAGELAPAATLVKAGFFHTCALVDGVAYCWGQNTDGQLGVSGVEMSLVPVEVDTALRFVDLDVGGGFTCGITVAREVYCWGAGDLGQLGDGDVTSGSVPRRVDTIGPAAAISLGESYACARLEDDTLWCWGHNDEFDTGTPGALVQPRPVQVGAYHFDRVAAGEGHACAQRDDGRLLCWGRSTTRQLGRDTPDPFDVVDEVTVDQSGAVALDCGQSHSCAVWSGQVYCWGLDSRTIANMMGVPNPIVAPEPVTSGDFVELALGRFSTCARRRDGSAQCWGRNWEGQLGLGEAIGYAVDTPTDMPIRDWRQLSMGMMHTCGVRADGSIWCFGLNDDGRLGVGDQDRRFDPTRVTIAP